MPNVNDHKKGLLIRAEKDLRGLAKDFPGWGSENYRDFLVDVPAGTHGLIRAIESHGMNPWTRYSVDWTDGSGATSYGVDPASVVEVATCASCGEQPAVLIQDNEILCEICGGA